VELLEYLALLGAVALGYLAGTLKSYMAEKGKNLATKEDIGEITRKIEEVRHEFADRIEARRMMHDLSTAALEKRLAVHQEAFTRCITLFGAATARDESEGNKAIHGHMQWWRENCLYLSPAASKAFEDACTAAFTHSALRDGVQAKTVTVEELTKNWKRIGVALEAIANDVKLPGIGATAREAVAPKPDAGL